MDAAKTGKLIARLRKEKGLTQKNVADALGVMDKTVSKWECGLGFPDLSYWSDLSTILEVDITQMMEGEIISNQPDVGNINKVKFYVCPSCGNILVSTGSASISCCGRKLEYLMTASESEKEELNISITEVDTDYFISITHPMDKDHYLSFAAYVKSDSVLLKRLYPEQSPSFRIPMNPGGKLYIYCANHGLTSIMI